MWIRHLLRLRTSPLEGPSDSIMVRALSRSEGVPQMVPSSKYQVLMSRSGTSLLISSMRG